MVYNLCLNYVQNAEDAEEITQDVFVSVYHSLGKFRQQSGIKTWIYRITINKSLDFLKAKKRKKRFAMVFSIFGADQAIIHEPVNFDHPGVELENREALEKLFFHINNLPDNQKTALLLSKTEQKSQAEIAEIMQVSAKAVESLLQRAKQNLRKNIGNREG